MNLIASIKIKTISVWRWFLKKPWRFSIVIILFFIILFTLNNNKNNLEEVIVEKRNLKRTVLSSGDLVSVTDLNLSFAKSGIVKEVRVSVGDSVKKDDILAVLNQGTLLASVTQAKAQVLLAKAKLEQVFLGAVGEEVRLAEINLEIAKSNLEQVKKEQDILVKNSRKILYSSDLEALPDANNISSVNLEISGVFEESISGVYKIKRPVNQYYFDFSGPKNFFVEISTIAPMPIGDSGLFLKSDTESRNIPNGDFWTVDIPNTKGINYKINKTNYDSVVSNANSLILSAESLVKQRQAELDLKKRQATNSEILIAQAEVLQAEGRLQSALSELNETYIKAPEDGVVTDVNIKVGELAEIQKSSFVIKNTESLFVESNINETNIDLIYKDAEVYITFDAFPEKVYLGKVSFIDPSETLFGGVVNYKIKVSLLETDRNIRPGLTANLIINIWSSEGIITVPYRAIFEKNGKKFVFLKKNKNQKEEVEVSIGRIGDGAVAEVISGLKEGDIVLIPK